MRYKRIAATIFVLGFVFFAPHRRVGAQDNKIMGQIDFAAASKSGKNAGIWIDGQYLGYVKELKGDKKVILLPGEHDVIARQTGYKEFEQKVTLEPGKTSLITIQLVKDPTANFSTSLRKSNWTSNPIAPPCSSTETSPATFTSSAVSAGLCWSAPENTKLRSLCPATATSPPK